MFGTLLAFLSSTMTSAKRNNFQFCCFDEDYVRQLRDGTPSVEQHFATYFGELLGIKLRSRVRSPELIEDIKQETLLRVLHSLRRRENLRNPERLGAFVLAVCNNVICELLRAETRYTQGDDNDFDGAATGVDAIAALVNEQRKGHVRQVLSELPARDREVLRLLFLEELDGSEVCRRLGVTESYLRVLLFRAKARFREVSLTTTRTYAAVLQTARERPTITPAGSPRWPGRAALSCSR